MKDKSIKLSDVSILSAHDVDDNLLADFYNNNPLNNSSLIKYWKWKFYSSSFKNKIPLVMVYNGRVIAHIGLIPFEVFLCGNKYKASWMTDLSVLPEFQSRGAGMGRKLVTLTKKWMEFSDLNLAIGNNNAIKFLKHFGWIESFDTYLHCYLLMPFNYSKFASSIPPFLRKILNIASRPFLNIIYYKYAFSIDNLRLDNLNSNSLDKFMTALSLANRAVLPIRDSDYVSWRLLDSPDRAKYRIFTIEGINDVSIVIKMCNKHHPKYIDLLWVSNPSKYSVIRDMISTLAIWGRSKGYSYICYYTSNKELSRYLSKSLKSIVNHPRFAFYAKDITLLEKLKHCNWHWELIDSDFERF